MLVWHYVVCSFLSNSVRVIILVSFPFSVCLALKYKNMSYIIETELNKNNLSSVKKYIIGCFCSILFQLYKSFFILERQTNT